MVVPSYPIPPYSSSPRQGPSPGDRLVRQSLARLLVQRQEGQLWEGSSQAQYSTLQVDTALWGRAGTQHPPQQGALSRALPLPTASPYSSFFPFSIHLAGGKWDLVLTFHVWANEVLLRERR